MHLIIKKIMKVFITFHYKGQYAGCYAGHKGHKPVIIHFIKHVIIQVIIHAFIHVIMQVNMQFIIQTIMKVILHSNPNKLFGSGVSREPYKSLGPFCCYYCCCCSFATNFESCDWSMRISLVILLGSHWSE